MFPQCYRLSVKTARIRKMRKFCLINLKMSIFSRLICTFLNVCYLNSIYIYIIRVLLPPFSSSIFCRNEWIEFLIFEHAATTRAYLMFVKLATEVNIVDSDRLAFSNIFKVAGTTKIWTKSILKGCSVKIF